MVHSLDGTLPELWQGAHTYLCSAGSDELWQPAAKHGPDPVWERLLPVCPPIVSIGWQWLHATVGMLSVA